MNGSSSSQREADFDPEQLVTDYLESHPDYFEHHLQLLSSLKVPHPSGAAISLVERHMQSQRTDNENLRNQLSELVDNARQNETLHKALHKLMLELLAASSMDDVLNTVDQRVRQDFQASHISVRLVQSSSLDPELANRPELVDTDDPAQQTLKPLLQMRSPVCGQLKPEQLRGLFGDNTDDIQSTALIPLATGNIRGVLAIASRNPTCFHPGKGTLFLANLGELVSRSLSLCLQEPGD